MRDPKLLNPGPVSPMEREPEPESTPEDTRPIWLRALRSLRPSFGAEKDKKTGKLIGTVELKGHVDF